MKIVVVSSLFPFENNPKHGIFVETRLRHFQQQYQDVEIKVIAPIPYFPFSHSSFGMYATYAKAPKRETRWGIEVFHPRYLVLPKVGMYVTPYTLAACIEKQARMLIEQGFDFHLIDGHYFYPDGVAIAKVAKRLSKPFTVTARGTDINLIPQYPAARKQIQTVFKQSNHNMAVCEALRQEMIKLGAEEQNVTTLRNGVDLQLFSLVNKTKQVEVREELDLPANRAIILSVGHLIDRKGHHLVIEAMRHIPDAMLLIAGDGPEKKRLASLISEYNLTERVFLLGSLSQQSLAQYYGAANLLVLASDREGWANVLLESMACGTPVVATNIWGTPEVVNSSDAGILVNRDAADIARGITQILDNLPKRDDTRRYAEQFDWHSTSEGQYKIFNQIVKEQVK